MLPLLQKSCLSLWFIYHLYNSVVYILKKVSFFVGFLWSIFLYFCSIFRLPFCFVIYLSTFAPETFKHIFVMNSFKEFEVVIPFDVFEHLTALFIADLLLSFHVRFILKGKNCDSLEYLVVCPSLSVAKSVQSLLISLKNVVLASAFSSSDKLRCSNWIFGAIR